MFIINSFSSYTIIFFFDLINWHPSTPRLILTACVDRRCKAYATAGFSNAPDCV